MWHVCKEHLWIKFAYTGQSWLKSHVETVHEGKRPFKCKYCEKSFGIKDTLKIHTEAVHDGLRPYACDSCDHAFYSKQYLRKHVESIHEGKKPKYRSPKKCEFCDQKFPTFTKLWKSWLTYYEFFTSP